MKKLTTAGLVLAMLIVCSPTMASVDCVVNFGQARLASGINAAATSITLTTGGAAVFSPCAGQQFNVTVWNSTDYADPARDPNVEIVRVIGISGDVLTVTRAQESTSAVTHNTAGKTYRLAQLITKKMITDLATGGGVNSFNSRTGVVTPQSSDYATFYGPIASTYITQTPDANLTAEQALSGLSTGIVKVTNGTGVLSTAVAGDFPTLNQSTSGNAATASAFDHSPATCSSPNVSRGISASGAAACVQLAISETTGTVPETRGGTNQTLYALGDMLFASAANTLAKLTGNTTTTKKYLTQTGDGANSAAPIWGTIAAGDVPTLNQSTTGNANTATALAADPTDCSANQFATAIVASGNLTCAQPSASNLSNNVTGTAGTPVVLQTSPTINAPAFSGDPVPTTDNARAIGSSSLRFLNGFLFNVLGGAETGTNTAGTDLIISADQPTGTAAARSIIFKAGTPQTTGTTAHPLVTIAQFKDCGSAATSKPCALFPDGTAAQPVIAPASGPTNGIYFNGAGIVQFAITGTNAMNVVSTGMSFPTNAQKIIFNSAANDVILTDEGLGILGIKALTDNNVRIFTNNNAYQEVGSKSELLTLSTGGTTTATAGNLVPLNSQITAIAYRITTTIATATAFTITPTGGTAFVNPGTATSSQSVMTSGTTGVVVPSTFATQSNGTAKTVTITTTGTPSAGAIRLTVFYTSITPPTS